MLGGAGRNGDTVDLHLGCDGARTVSRGGAHVVHLGHGDAVAHELAGDIRNAVGRDGALGGCGELGGGVTGDREATELNAHLGADEACEILAGESLDDLVDASIDDGRFLNCHEIFLS